MDQDDKIPLQEKQAQNEKDSKNGILGLLLSPFNFLKKLSDEMHWSFVLGVVIVYGINQGIGLGLSKVSTQYYMKDEQKLQPSEAQVYHAMIMMPWIVKPLWGLLTDTVPIGGRRRRPYFIFAGGALGVLSIPAALVILVGMIIQEPIIRNFSYKRVTVKFLDAGRAMWTALKCPVVWRPCLYMYLSLAVSLHIHEGMFYWYTDAKTGPLFSQEVVGSISAIGAMGSLLGVLLYQNAFRTYPFRRVLFWAQLLYGASGMLDLILVLRVNLLIGVPDYILVIFDSSISHMIGRLKWMPLLVLSSKLCPSGIEGTFFALLMSIDHIGSFSASWAGGFLLHTLNVTRTEFDNLWLAIIVRSVFRVLPIGILFLVPNSDPNVAILPAEMLRGKKDVNGLEGISMEMESLVNDLDS
ncbi:hypothetical protein OROHE_005786 [Orobanche hederae]